MVLEGPGVSVDRVVSESVAKQVALLVIGAQVAPEQPAAGRQLALSDLERRASLREWVAEFNPKRNPEKIAVIADYLARHGGKASVGRRDIAAGFEEMREPAPANLSRDIAWAIKIGWLAPTPNDPELFYVTRTGSSAVAQKFPPEVRAKTRVGSGARKRKA